MIAVIIAILTFTVIGLLLTLVIDRSAQGPLLAGLALLYGSGAVMFALMLLSLLHIAWSAVSATTALLIFALFAVMIARRSKEAVTPRGEPLRPHILDVATAILAAGFTAYVTVASPWEWDFWGVWGVKARVFLEHGGIDWRWLESDWHDYAHGDYPLLVPMNYALPGLLHGGWNDRWLGLLFVSWGLAVLLIVRALTAGETANWVSAAATLASVPAALSLHVGTAEGALIAFAGAALLFLRRALRDDRPVDWRHGTLLLGLAANCKNEGLALIAATAIGIVAADPRRSRRVLRLWPALLLAFPWLLLRTTHSLLTDIAAGNIIGRLLERLAYPTDILLALDQALVDRWAWVAIIATFAIVPRAVSRERFMILVTVLQIAFCIAVYFITPNELAWHIVTSWPRLPRQVQLPITVVSVMLLGEMFVRERSRGVIVE